MIDEGELLSSRLAWETMAVFLKCALPLLGVALLFGVLGQGAQTRFNVSFQSIRPKWSKLNPITGNEAAVFHEECDRTGKKYD